MVANSPIERVGQGQVDYLLNRLADIERRLDQGGARSSFPFSVGHLGVTDFQIIPSASGDGSADIAIGNGAGGKLIQVYTDSSYGTKILTLRDQSGNLMLSTDALAGYGVGVPTYPFVYAGFETLNMSGATTVGTARDIARGVNYVYNPCVFVAPRIRLSSTTNETAQVFVQWRDKQGNLSNTASLTVNLAAGVAQVVTPSFGKVWDSDDMNGSCALFLKCYCTTANPANVSATASYNDGYGVSRGFYDQFASGWLT